MASQSHELHCQQVGKDPQAENDKELLMVLRKIKKTINIVRCLFL